MTAWNPVRELCLTNFARLLGKWRHWKLVNSSHRSRGTLSNLCLAQALVKTFDQDNLSLKNRDRDRRVQKVVTIGLMKTWKVRAVWSACMMLMMLCVTSPDDPAQLTSIFKSEINYSFIETCRESPAWPSLASLGRIIIYPYRGIWLGSEVLSWPGGGRGHHLHGNT